MKILSNVDPYGRSHWEKFIRMYRFLAKQGLTIDDVKKGIEPREDIDKKHTEYVKSLPPCPECGWKMDRVSVNTEAANQTGDDSIEALLCANPDCMNVLYR